MKVQHRQVLASAMGAGMVCLLLLLISLADLFTIAPPEKIELREVQMYAPPPPPPPPPVNQAQNNASSSPSMQLKKIDTQIILEEMDLEVELQAGAVGDFGDGLAGINEGLGENMGMTGFSNLDGVPMVLNAPIMTFPEEALERGIYEYRVVFHIMIDEEGRVYPVSIVENPFPQMNENLREYASRVRFSPPTRLGVPVKTEYLWPVLFKSE